MSGGMKRRAFVAILRTEFRLRLRRNNTYIAMLAVMLAVWFMIVDPSSGHAMLVADKARVSYDSTALAFGSSVLATVLFGLFGFYLVRGRVDEDLRNGVGHVLAATPVDNSAFILGRWAGGVAYLGALTGVLALTMLVLQAIRGEGRVQPLVYLQFYLLTMLPAIFFISAMASLCDAHRLLMGKWGDLLYFVFWIAQIAAIGITVSGQPDSVWVLGFDSTGMGVLTQRAQLLLQTPSIAVGFNAFDKTLAPVALNPDFWTWPMIASRVAAAAVAAIPLWIAVRLFHRFSPDRVSATPGRQRWALVGAVNRLTRPLDVFARPLLALAARLPGLAGQICADLALTFSANPLTGPLLAVALIAGSLLDYALLTPLLIALTLYWGIVIADFSVRDFKAGTEQMGAAVTGGPRRRYWRQSIGTLLLGFALTAPVLLRWGQLEPLRALSLAIGIVAVTGAAQCLGRGTRTARAFLVIFLFWMYIATQANDIAWLDIFGMHAIATAGSITGQAVAGLLLLAAGYEIERRRART